MSVRPTYDWRLGTNPVVLGSFTIRPQVLYFYNVTIIVADEDALTKGNGKGPAGPGVETLRGQQSYNLI